MKYLNSTGIVRFWNNIKSYITSQIPTKVSELVNDSNYLTSVPDHDASKITSGTIDIARLPQGALERLAIVADESARFALTSSNVQVGDVVKQSDTGLMYMVVDESNLNNSAGYVEFTAGTATSVPWSGITDKPTNFVTTDTTQTISGAKTFSSPVKTAGHKLVGDFSDLNDAYYNNELCAYVPSTLNNPTGGYGTVWTLNAAVNVPDNPYTSWINQIAFYSTGIKRRYRSNGGAWGSWENLLTESTAKPSSNNTQDLGSSSYQWNNTYTNKLYLNGTEFGLGTNNVWTGDNTFSSGEIKLGANNIYKLGRYLIMDADYEMTASDFVNKIGFVKVATFKANTNSAPRRNDGDYDILSLSTNAGYSTYLCTTPRNDLLWYGKFWSSEWQGWKEVVNCESNQVITGEKTFSRNVRSRHSSLVRGTLPSEEKANNSYIFEDSAGTATARIIRWVNTDGYNGLSYQCWNAQVTTDTSVQFALGYDTSGNGYAVIGGDNFTSFHPTTTNAYDFGTSSYQWNKIYSKEYYYNGTEFQNKFVTLDNNQVIPAYKRFKHPRFSSDNVIDITQTSYESAINVGYVDFVDNAVKWWGNIEVKVLPDASSQMIFYLSNWKADGTQGVTGFALDYSKDFSTVNFTSGNGITNLGTSSYQWKTVHAKNYYYNGTEFQNKFVTLDTAQTITWSKEFTSSSFVTARGYRFRIKNDSMVLGTVPSEGNQWTGFQFIDKNDATISEIVQSFQSNGNSLYQINVFPNETNSEKRSLLAYTYNSTSGANHIQFSSHLIPQSTNTYNVGDTSRQWLDTCTQNLFLNGEKYTSIPLGSAGDDLNNCFLTSIGIAKYYAGTFAFASNVANLPNAGIPFAMKSETVRYISASDKIIHQRIIQNGIEYTRVCSGTAWSSWVSQYALKTGSASTDGTVTNTYFKIASFEVGVNRYFGAILQVQDLCYTQKQTVITINIRTNVDGTFQVGRLYLHNSSEISPENFILCYKEDTDKVLCELYYYQTSRWEGIRFSVLSETMHGSTLFDIMTVYNAVQSDAVASLPTGYTTIQSTFMPLSEDLIPTSNNLYTLGSSNNQWNKVYSKEYYYNGTQWGLDKANIWSIAQTIRGQYPDLVCQNSDIAMGSNVNTGGCAVCCQDSVGNNLAYISMRVNSASRTVIELCTRNTYKDGFLSNESGCELKASSWYFGHLWNGAPYYQFEGGAANNMYPMATGTYELGTSSFKWRTINGLNPGALSLPSETYVQIDPTNWNTTGTSANAYTPTVDGWLGVQVQSADTSDTSDQWVFAGRSTGGSDYYPQGGLSILKMLDTSAGRLIGNVFIPVKANKLYHIRVCINKTQTEGSVIYARFYPSLGNV